MAAEELIRKWMMNTEVVGVVLSLFSGVGAKQQVPCYFIFGDSLVDNGNNNVLQSLARADYLPYGIDFNGEPTGRFSNGKTNVDVIAAGSSHQSSMLMFLLNHMPRNSGYGARKMMLFGIGQVGCSPNELAHNSQDGRTCVEKINSANQIFNNRLKSIVDQFNKQLSGARFICINYYGIFQDIINSPSAYCFKVTNAGCCGVGRNNGQITCLPMQIPCANRREYLFWDAYHPNEAGNAIIGSRAYSAQSASDAYPSDIRRLAKI